MNGMELGENSCKIMVDERRKPRISVANGRSVELLSGLTPDVNVVFSCHTRWGKKTLQSHRELCHQTQTA